MKKKQYGNPELIVREFSEDVIVMSVQINFGGGEIGGYDDFI